MANPVTINPTLTLAGQKAAFNASNDGIELKLTHVSFGRAHYDPTGDETALKQPVGNRVPLAGASRPTPYQIRMVSSWREDVGEVPIAEIGFWAGDVLAFVWSKADGSIASYKTDGVTYVLFNDLAFAQVPAGSIGFVVDPNESVALAALAAHEGAANAHPQYLLRSDVAKDSGPLAWLGVAGGTENDLVLKLVAAEAALSEYSPGQRFQFKAKSTNTKAVTANIEGIGVKPVKKAGDGGLVDVEPGDIKADGIYDLNDDGSCFQLGGGVGSGKAFARFSFTAAAGQTVFPAEHTTGATIVLRQGREVTDYASDGTKVTFGLACELGESVEILAFKSFKVADTFTKAEITALVNTTSGLPVGAMVPFPKGTVPQGFLEVDGSVQSAATYPDLAEYLGTTFNKGDEGVGNFRLPESRGEFLRGWDHGRGVDPGRALGSWQKGTMVSADTTGSADGMNVIGLGTTVATPLSDFGIDQIALSNYPPQICQIPTSGLSAVNPIVTGSTRPRNLAVMWCIKAWSAPVNQGAIDVAALVKELAALKSATPVGAVIPFPKAAVPPGYLELDGSVQSIATYPDLAAYLGTAFNTGGEGAGNFRLPDSRGEFLRGWDHGRGVDAGRAVGTYQKGSVMIGDFDGNGSNAAFSVTTIGAVSGDAALKSLGLDAPVVADYSGAGYVAGAPSTAYALTAGYSGVVRPRNLAVMWCIKAWNAPVNQGNIDVAALAPLAAQATEINQGTAKVATTAQMLDSANDLVMPTPKKLRWGLSVSLASNGYIAAPFWLGGWVIQWGTTGAVSPTPAVVSFPMAFPSAAYVALAIGYLGETNVGSNQDAIYSFGLSKNGVSFKTYGSVVANGAKYIAIGS